MRIKIFLLICGFVVVFCGCATTGKGPAKVSGPWHEVLIIKKLARLQVYKSVVFKPFTNDLGDSVSSDLLSHLNDTVARELKKNMFLSTGGTTVRVEGRVIHLVNTSSTKYMVVNVQLTDDHNSLVLINANVSGQVMINQDISEAVLGIAEGVKNLLQEYVVPSKT